MINIANATQEHTKSCFDVIRDLNEQLGLRNLQETELIDQNLKLPSVVFHQKVFDSQTGDEFIVVKRLKGRGWYALSRTPGIIDPQGHPLWIFNVAGNELAEFLGFKEIDDATLQIPSPPTLLKKLESLNASLLAEGKQSLDLGWYLQSRLSDSDYIFHFTEEIKSPLANPDKNLNHYLHDISFHLGSIIIPREAIRFAAEKSRFLKHLSNVLLSRPELRLHLSAEELATLQKDLLKDLVLAIDSEMGSIANYLASTDAAQELRSLKRLHQKLYELLTLSGDYFKASDFPSMRIANKVFSFTYALEDSKKIHPIAFVKFFEEAYSIAQSTYRPLHYDIFGSSRIMTEEEFCQLTQARRLELLAASRRLLETEN